MCVGGGSFGVLSCQVHLDEFTFQFGFKLMNGLFEIFNEVYTLLLFEVGRFVVFVF